MKRIFTYLIFIAMLAGAAGSCKPKAYTGPLESPVGNWAGSASDYYFNGELVGEIAGCQYSVISFYSQGLCCIEGMTGAFEYVYDKTTGSLQIDSTLWTVQSLTGLEMVLRFEGRIFPEASETDSESGEAITYKGMSILSDADGHYYLNGSGTEVRCYSYDSTDAEGNSFTDFWYDTHTDTFVPYE